MAKTFQNNTTFFMSNIRSCVIMRHLAQCCVDVIIMTESTNFCLLSKDRLLYFGCGRQQTWQASEIERLIIIDPSRRVQHCAAKIFLHMGH